MPQQIVSNCSHDGMGGLTRLDPERLASVPNVIADSMRQAIVSGAFAPGQRLVQQELAATLGVSRQPVREAIQRLEAEGLVSRISNGRLVVRHYSNDEIVENFELRAILESFAAGVGASRVTDADIADLRSIQRELEAAVANGGNAQVVDLNRKLHSRIYGLSGKPTLIRLIGQLWINVTVLSPIFIPARGSHSLAEHKLLIDALAERDPDKAKEAMRKHIETAAREFFEWRPENSGSSQEASAARVNTQISVEPGIGKAPASASADYLDPRDPDHRADRR